MSQSSESATRTVTNEQLQAEKIQLTGEVDRLTAENTRLAIENARLKRALPSTDVIRTAGASSMLSAVPQTHPQQSNRPSDPGPATATTVCVEQKSKRQGLDSDDD